MAKSKHFLLQVYETYASDMSRSLSRQGMSFEGPERVDSFDGSALAEFLIPVTGTFASAIALVLGTWVKRRKFFRVVIEGKVFEGYTPQEVHKLVTLLRKDKSDDNRV